VFKTRAPTNPKQRLPDISEIVTGNTPTNVGQKKLKKLPNVAQ